MYSKKKLVVIFFLLSSLYLQAQDTTSFLNSLEFKGVIGIKAFNPYASDEPIYNGAFYFPPILGFEVYSPGIRTSINLRQSYFYSLSARDTINGDIAYSRVHTSLGLTYHFKRNSPGKRPVRVGAAYSLIRTKDIFTSVYGFPSKMWGASIFVGVPLKWLDVELRADPDQEDVLGGDKYSLCFVYRFGSGKKESKAAGGNELNLLIGEHTYLNRYYFDPNNSKEDYSPVMVMPEIGLQYVLHNYNLAIEARRNMWLGFTAGNPQYSINGNMQHIFLGMSRSKQIRKAAFTYGFAHAWILDIGNKLKVPVGQLDQLEFYPEKGIALTLGVPVRKINIEVRAIYAYHVNEFLNSPVINKFDRYRVSLGALYKLNPAKSSK